MASGAAAIFAAILSVLAISQPVQNRPTAEQIREARAEADRIIASAGHPAGLANVTEGASPAVLHLASNLECRFLSGRTTRISNDEADTHVACFSGLRGGELISAALPVDRQVALEELARSATGWVLTAYPDAIYEQNFSLPPTSEAGQPVGRQFKATKDGTDLAIVVIAAQRNGWVYYSMVSGPYDLKDTFQTVAIINMVSITDSFSKSR